MPLMYDAGMQYCGMIVTAHSSTPPTNAVRSVSYAVLPGNRHEHVTTLRIEKCL